MDYNSGLVYEPEKARPGLTQSISTDKHKKAIDSGVDVPVQSPGFKIDLDAVGINAKKVWVLLPQGRLCFDAEITVHLPGRRRGIHMSRMEQAISRLYPITFNDLRQYAKELVSMILEMQDGSSARVILKGSLPHLYQSSVTRHLSVDAVDLRVEARAWRQEDVVKRETITGVRVNHITACPCTQVYNDEIFGAGRGNVPMPTHSQRSATMLSVQDNDGAVSCHDLLNCLVRSLHVTQDLLKRPDEAEIVLKAHENPQFAEDAVRDVAASFGELYAGRLLPESEVHIEATSFESIHSHNVVCRLKTTAASLGVRS